jgi:hypothetical protein
VENGTSDFVAHETRLLVHGKCIARCWKGIYLSTPAGVFSSLPGTGGHEHYLLVKSMHLKRTKSFTFVSMQWCGADGGYKCIVDCASQQLVESVDVLQAALLEYVDLWSHTRTGQPVAVKILSPLDMFEISPDRPQGSVVAISNALHRCLPRFAVVSSSSAIVEHELKAQLNL